VFSLCFLCCFPLQLSPSVLWYCWLGPLTCKNRLPYNLYCVGGDVKHCSINQSTTSQSHTTKPPVFSHPSKAPTKANMTVFSKAIAETYNKFHVLEEMDTSNYGIIICVYFKCIHSLLCCFHYTFFQFAIYCRDKMKKLYSTCMRQFNDHICVKFCLKSCWVLSLSLGSNEHCSSNTSNLVSAVG